VVDRDADARLQFADLPVEQIQRVLVAWRERMLDLKKTRASATSSCSRTTAPAPGATLEHSHSQIIATPIIPKMVQEELDGAAATSS
jgi:UDPglucose--hexose-1-phosphate uridylyltransferase